MELGNAISQLMHTNFFFWSIFDSKTPNEQVLGYFTPLGLVILYRQYHHRPSHLDWPVNKKSSGSDDDDDDDDDDLLTCVPYRCCL